MEQKKRTRGVALSFDYGLALVVAALLILGLMMVYSTTFDWSLVDYGSPYAIFLRQLAWVLIGLVGAAAVYRIRYTSLRRLSVPLMGLVLLGLVGVLVVGKVVFGATRTLAGASIQPSEVAKLVTIIYLADWLSSKGERLRRFSLGLLPFVISIGVVAGLITLQPDLSMAMLIVFVAVTMFFYAGANLVHLGVGLVVAAGGFVALIRYYPHSAERLNAFLNDPTQAGWHIRQVLIALGSGGLAGKGLGQGIQKFGILPTPHTDSVFAVVGEELGLIGCVVVVALFGLLAYRGFRIALRVQDPFGSVLAVGITCALLYEAVINIAVMTALVPFTGLPLPFISYGGSSMLVSLIGVGLLLSISREAASPSPAEDHAGSDRRRRDRRARLPGSRRRPGA
jgi:cell division protein FtsW